MNTFVYLWYVAEFCLKWDVSDKSYRENKKTHFILDNISSENLTVYEIMWNNMAEPDWSQMTIYV